MVALFLAPPPAGIPPALSSECLRVIDDDAVKKLAAVIYESFVLGTATLIKLMIGHGLEVQRGGVTEAMIRDWAIFRLRRLANAAVGDVVQGEQCFEFGFKEGHLVGGHVFFQPEIYVVSHG